MEQCYHLPTTSVIVTGGASGIGLACAEAMAAVGRPVAIWDLSAQKSAAAAERIAQACGVPVIGLGVDVSNNQAIGEAMQETRRRLPAIGALVHAAGVVIQAPLEKVTEENWSAVMDVNLRALVFLMQAVLPDLKANPGSAVVGIASMNATLGSGLIPAYTASKGGLLSLVKSLADSLANEGIRINAVSPGAIRTPMLLPEGDDSFVHVFERRAMLGRLGESREIATAVRFLLSDDASYITGTELVVDGGFIPSQRL